MEKSKIPAAQREAIGMLIDDHRTVKKLFKEFEGAKERSQQEQIAQQTCHELTVHAQIEEEIFYPSLRGQSDELDDLLDEAKVEHQVAKDLIAAIEGDLGGEMLEANYKVLSEYVGHHVEEEEGEMFKKVMKTGMDMKEVAQQMLTRKEELMATA